MQKTRRRALDEGYLGPVDRHAALASARRRPVPRHLGPLAARHASEYRSLANVVRTRDRVLQATPNALTKSTVAILGMISTGVGRKPLRTTIVAAMDVKTDRKIYAVATTRRHAC